jgi:hypothetical protein
MHDRPHHLAQRRITYLLRRALDDLFLGLYSVLWSRPQRGQIKYLHTACVTDNSAEAVRLPDAAE